MSKPKAAVRDYDADLRFAPPPPENATRKELPSPLVRQSRAQRRWLRTGKAKS